MVVGRGDGDKQEVTYVPSYVAHTCKNTSANKLSARAASPGATASDRTFGVAETAFASIGASTDHTLIEGQRDQMFLAGGQLEWLSK